MDQYQERLGFRRTAFAAFPVAPAQVVQPFSLSSSAQFPHSELSFLLPGLRSANPVNGPHLLPTKNGRGNSSPSPPKSRQPKMSIPLSRRPDCMYFIKGVCTKGDDCIFRHNLLAKAGVQEICETWIRDHLCDDQLCKKLHPKKLLRQSERPEKPPAPTRTMVVTPTREKTLPSVSIDHSNSSTFTPLKPSLIKKPDCMFFVRGGCSKGDKCSFRHNELARNGSLEVCEVWEREGGCSDASCPHLHPRAISHSSSFAIVSNANVCNPWPKRPDCLFFVRGNCTKGDSCIFRHNELARNGPKEICACWKQFNVCYDNDCVNLHPKNLEQFSLSPETSPTTDALNIQFENQMTLGENHSKDENLSDFESFSRVSIDSLEADSLSIYGHIIEIISDTNIVLENLRAFFEKVLHETNVVFHFISSKEAVAIFDFPETALKAIQIYSRLLGNQYRLSTFAFAKEETKSFVLNSGLAKSVSPPTITVLDQTNSGVVVQLEATDDCWIKCSRFINSTWSAPISFLSSPAQLTVQYDEIINAKCYKPYYVESRASTFTAPSLQFSDFSLTTSASSFFEKPSFSRWKCEKLSTQGNAINLSDFVVKDTNEIVTSFLVFTSTNSDFLCRVKYFFHPPDPLVILYDDFSQQTLDVFLASQSSAVIDLKFRLSILHDVVAGLCYLHSHEFVHGCLRAFTILINDNKIKLCAYGLGSISTHINFYNIFYFSPVMFERAHICTSSDDIYAFGTICYLVSIPSGKIELPDDLDKFSEASPVGSRCSPRSRHSARSEPNTFSLIRNDIGLTSHLPSNEILSVSSLNGLYSNSNEISFPDIKCTPYNTSNSPSLSPINTLSKTLKPLQSSDKSSSETLERLVRFFQSGRKLEIPLFVEYGIGHLINQCWKKNPNSRPTSLQVSNSISKMIAEKAL